MFKCPVCGSDLRCHKIDTSVLGVCSFCGIELNFRKKDFLRRGDKVELLHDIGYQSMYFHGSKGDILVVASTYFSNHLGSLGCSLEVITEKWMEDGLFPEKEEMMLGSVSEFDVRRLPPKEDLR